MINLFDGDRSQSVCGKKWFLLGHIMVCCKVATTIFIIHASRSSILSLKIVNQTNVFFVFTSLFSLTLFNNFLLNNEYYTCWDWNRNKKKKNMYGWQQSVDACIYIYVCDYKKRKVVNTQNKYCKSRYALSNSHFFICWRTFNFILFCKMISLLVRWIFQSLLVDVIESWRFSLTLIANYENNLKENVLWKDTLY
jgi:hypothetical protein